MGKNYIVVDLGTGNSRVGLVSSAGKIYEVESFENVYHRDDLYEDGQYFIPEEWKNLILDACTKVISRHPEIHISAVTSAGARQSIVLCDQDGKAFYGLPNIDNRGRAWMNEIQDKEYIYERSGRWVTEDFPAAKIYGYGKKYPEDYKRIYKMTSISEWIGAIFTGKWVIEPSQACETQLFDIETLTWNEKVCSCYGISTDMLPEICRAGTSLGAIDSELGQQIKLPQDCEFIVGGADTQVAVRGANIQTNDVAIVSGTTSPVVTIVDYKYYDQQQRCWTDSNLGGDTYQVETNPGVTGLNYQRMKKMMFPDTPYDELDKMMVEKTTFLCTASFSSLNFSKRQSLKSGGFVMGAPFDATCELSDLMWAVIADIACSISRQYDSLCTMIAHKKDYILGCGGGFQSKVLCQMVADLTGKELVIHEGFEQASINGCVKVCNDYYQIQEEEQESKKTVFRPCEDSLVTRYYDTWLSNRQMLNSEQ